MSTSSTEAGELAARLIREGFMKVRRDTDINTAYNQLASLDTATDHPDAVHRQLENAVVNKMLAAAKLDPEVLDSYANANYEGKNRILLALLTDSPIAHRLLSAVGSAAAPYVMRWGKNLAQRVHSRLMKTPLYHRIANSIGMNYDAEGDQYVPVPGRISTESSPNLIITSGAIGTPSPYGVSSISAVGVEGLASAILPEFGPGRLSTSVVERTSVS